MNHATLYLPDEDATRAAGALLGRTAADTDAIAAEGTLGAGKTCLAQGVARGLEVPPGHYVNSPTFAILQTHPGRLPFHHIDLYRISDPDEALGLGLEELVGVEGVSLVEWPARLPDLVPPDHLHARLAAEGEGRRLDLTASGPRSRRWLQAFVDARSAEAEKG